MFGKILKKLREEKYLKQKDIAKVLGVTDRAVGHYESGARRASQEILEMLADYFYVSVDYLLGRTEVKNYENIKNYPNLNVDGLPDDAIDEIKKYIELIKLKYNQDKANNK